MQCYNILHKLQLKTKYSINTYISHNIIVTRAISMHTTQLVCQYIFYIIHAIIQYIITYTHIYNGNIACTCRKSTYAPRTSAAKRTNPYMLHINIVPDRIIIYAHLPGCFREYVHGTPPPRVCPCETQTAVPIRCVTEPTSHIYLIACDVFVQ